MEAETPSPQPVKRLPLWVYGLFFIIMLVIGIGAGFLVITQQNPAVAALVTQAASGPESEQKTIASTKDLKPEDFRDSSTGTILVKPAAEKRKQGTHILKRDDSPWPIYIVSPVVDLTKYENKHVKISGVTYNGGTSDWYMTVNKIEEK